MITKILKSIKLNSANNISKVSKLPYSSLTYDPRSTIFAVASGKGKCGVSVIRVSGPKAFDVNYILYFFIMYNLTQFKQNIVYIKSHPKAHIKISSK
jgi:hypothetical protein